MSAPTRRALLAGGAALATVAAAPSPAVHLDAALLELDAEQCRLDAKLQSLNQAFWRTPIEDMAELHRLSDLSTPLADRMDAITEQMEGMPAATLQGLAAKAYALRYQLTMQHSTAGVVDQDYMNPEERLAWSLAEDLLRSSLLVGSAHP